jgi:eukaryotic-like serine/threonine-protein kinase
MTRREHSSGDLLFGLFALARGHIDQQQLVAAVETWDRDDTHSLAEILVRQGAVDRPARAQLNKLVALRLGGIPVEEKSSPRAGFDMLQTVTHVSDAFPTSRRPDEPQAPATVKRESEAAAAGGRFRIVKHFARGGLGEVFLAHDPELDRHVALKEIQAHRAFDSTSQSRFLLEARITGRLEHPGIVPVYGLGQYPDGRPYYAMRLIEGETLTQAIERFHGRDGSPRESGEREVAFRRLLRSLIDACNAVAYAHSRGVVHRDLKPDNIMLGPFGETLVVDWGLAKVFGSTDRQPEAGISANALADDPSLTAPGGLIGTPTYMSPEQARGEVNRIGPLCDVYSLGATLYCLLAGHGPYPTGDLDDVLERARRGYFPEPRRLRRTVDPALNAICLKAMALEPGNRHASPLELAGEIEAWLADLRYRNEQVRALNEAKRSLANLCLERARNLFGRELIGEGMLWLARALENVAADSPDLERAIRASLAGWHAAPKLLQRNLAHGAELHCVRFSPDGRRLVTIAGDRTAKLWDVAKAGLLFPAIHHGSALTACAFSPDGSLLVTASEDGLVRRWDAVSGAPVGEPMRHDGPVKEVCFSPDGSKLATASQTGTPLLWETATGQALGTPAGVGGEILAIAFNADGTRLAAADASGQVRIWDSASVAPLETMLAHDAPVSVVRFSPDGRFFVTGCQDGRARIWDTQSWTSVAELLHRATASFLEFSARGQYVATAGQDGAARLWNAQTLRPIGEPLAHGGRVDCLAFNAAGTVVATGSIDGTARLWDTATGLPIGPSLTHKGVVRAVVFAPDGKRLATACSDGHARLWRVPEPVTGDAERVACWVRVATELNFDEGDVIGSIEQLALWEMRRRLQELGGAPLK